MAKGQDIVSVIKQQIEQFGAPLSMIDVGNVIEVGDGIARGLGLGDLHDAVDLGAYSDWLLYDRRAALLADVYATLGGH